MACHVQSKQAGEKTSQAGFSATAEQTNQTEYGRGPAQTLCLHVGRPDTTQYSPLGPACQKQVGTWNKKPFQISHQKSV